MKELKIKNSAPVQSDFLGNGAIYHGYAGMPDDCGRVYSPELCELEAARAVDMRLKLARTFYTWWAFDEKSGKWDWDNEIMTVFYSWLSKMKKGGITVLLNTGWCSPGDLDGHGWTNTPPFTKCPFIVENDRDATIKNYADWVSETVHQLIEKRGFTNIKILTLFTEPQSSGKKSPAKPYEWWRDSAVAAHEALVRDGRRSLVKLMGPQEASIPSETETGLAGDMLDWVVQNTPDGVVDIYSCHVYPFAEPLKRKYLQKGTAAMGMSLAGGRFYRRATLKPNTKYKLSANILFEEKATEPDEAAVYLGVFQNRVYDIHASGRSGAADPLAEGSRRAIKQNELGPEYKTFELEFLNQSATEGLVGVFNDMRCYGLVAVGSISLTEAESGVSALENGDFANNTEGWSLKYATGTVDLYNDWYAWAKQAMAYVPKGMPFVYDEYQVGYDRDFSRDSHGSGVVNAAVAFMNAGVTASLIWTLFDQQWPSNHANTADCFVDGDHRYGVAPILTRTTVPHKSYYAFSLISRFVAGGGTKVFEGVGGDCLHTTMAISSQGEVTIIVVNDKDVGDSYTLSFEKPLSEKLRRYEFDPNTCKPDEAAELLSPTDTITLDGTIKDTIAPYGVVVYTNMK